MSYVITDKKWFDFFKELWGVSLNQEEAAQIIEWKEVFTKLLKKIYFSYQVDMMKGKLKGNEARVYIMWELMNEVINTIDDLDWKIQDYKKKEIEKQK